MIEGVTSSCYQPSIEDVGKKVIVHGIPASDINEYEGMPMFAEVGPLKLDPKVEKSFTEKIKEQEIIFQQQDSTKIKGKAELRLLPNKLLFADS